MGRLTSRTPLTRIVLDGPSSPRRKSDTLAVEEPLEIRLGGDPFSVTMRTPGHDVELTAGLLASEGIVRSAGDIRAAIHCGGPGQPAADATSAAAAPENTYNVLDVALAPDAARRAATRSRTLTTTSSCGVCGTASIEQLRVLSRFDVAADATRVSAELLASLPDALRRRQSVFDRTGGAHAAGLFDAATGDLLVLREDVGRHNAVDKVIGWALLDDRLPLSATVLQVSGRVSFELVQKAALAGIPILSAVSAPSSLAVELGTDAGVTIAGFVRDRSMNLYSRPDRVSA